MVPGQGGFLTQAWFDAHLLCGIGHTENRIARFNQPFETRQAGKVSVRGHDVAKGATHARSLRLQPVPRHDAGRELISLPMQHDIVMLSATPLALAGSFVCFVPRRDRTTPGTGVGERGGGCVGKTRSSTHARGMCDERH